MSSTSSFVIYNAAAGSGKTYTLVSEYLKKLLDRDFPDSYKYMLAITFTNKAVAEMKNRIIEKLTSFANPESVHQPDNMMSQLAEELGQSLEQVQQKSANILHHLLHNFAAFSVETIDSFNHRLIRTFSRELQLASNFEVTLDRDLLLDKAVDNVIAQSGSDKEITELLVEYTLRKTDDDRSWDIARDIKEIAANLFKEQEFREIESLLDIPIASFQNLVVKLRTERNQLTDQITAGAQQVLNLLSEMEIPHDSFQRKTLPNHFVKLAKGERKLYDNKLELRIEEGGSSLYPARVEQHIKDSIDSITEQLLRSYREIRAMVFEENKISKIINSLGPLSVLSLVYTELERIKQEDNIMPISDFNQRIHQEIKQQPAPYIYERLGDRFRNFFIDEFQDTSTLQWSNLQPLIENSLSQEFDDGKAGSLLLVGDPKQAIYRWRGGKPEQFIDLYNSQDPFSSNSKEVRNLGMNWRSRAEIIHFNNDFFTHIAGYFSDEDHRMIYELGNTQEQNELKDGYINIQFVNRDRKQQIQDEYYGEAILESISRLIEKGYSYSDICILTRWNREGIQLGELLASSNIPIVSSETLLLQHSSAVRFLANCLTYKENSADNDLAFELLIFLHNHLKIKDPIHQYLQKFVSDGVVNTNQALEYLGNDYNSDRFNQKSPLQACEYLIQCFKLAAEEMVYVERFMNLIYEFEQQRIFNELSFTDFWNLKKDKAALNATDGLDAVRIMTIHKSKGLEFPVVLFPYADLGLSDFRRMNVWIDTSDLDDRIDKVLIPMNQELENFGEKAATQYHSIKRLHEFDQVNLLYVAMTRAIDALFVYTRTPSKSKKDVATPDSFSDLFVSFLNSKNIFDESKFEYNFGNLPVKSKEDQEVPIGTIPMSYLSGSPESDQLKMASTEAKLWYSEKDIAISRGSVLHELMSKVKHKDDMEMVLESFMADVRFPESLKEEMAKVAREIISDPEIGQLFSDFQKVENEREILGPDSELLRPDRINFNTDGTLTVIDYKTGRPDDAFKRQLSRYSSALEAMGYKVKERLIIYANEDEVFINKV